MPKLQPGLRIYAIGDIHGQIDLVEQMVALIARDLRDRPPRGPSIEIFLGDYIDRGAHSSSVIELLARGAPSCDQRICLRGNHEELLLGFLEDPAQLDLWWSNGGAATAMSYGLSSSLRKSVRNAPLLVHERIAQLIPADHQEFLRKLGYSYRAGDYLFVHAGVRPGISIDKQYREDLVWIREPFLSSREDFGVRIVHGHTPVEAPDVRPNRINIDTGAFMTGRLTCLVLEGEKTGFIQARAQ
ncbi:MAG: metallophosphoesterase family protein [Parvibaculaceae bacterium]|jgi:serine/threonine protein phosphatase 1